MSLPCANRPHSRRHARRRPARRSAAGHPFGVPRVAGEPAQRIVGERAEREFRGIGPADDHRARPCEVARDREIFGGDDVREPRHSVRGRLPRLVHVLLDGDRDAVERTGGRAGPERFVESVRPLAGALAEVDGYRVEVRVDGLEPFAVRFHHLRARESPRARLRRRLDGTHLPDWSHRSSLSLELRVRIPPSGAVPFGPAVIPPRSRTPSRIPPRTGAPGARGPVRAAGPPPDAAAPAA